MNALTNIRAMAPLRVANVIDFIDFHHDIRISHAPRAPLVACWSRVPETGEILCRWARSDAPERV
jgi:hypothetical protein